jgi:WD40 repeat protein
MRHPTLALAFASSFLAASLGHADIIAVLDAAQSGRTDIVRFNATTGAALGLPATVNTAADEVHPAFSPDGTRLVFHRSDPSAGTNRIVVVDLATGTAADLFTFLEATLDPPTTPRFSADGTKVYTGHALAAGSPPSVVETSLANFPNGPFPHTVVALGGVVTNAIQTSHPTVGPAGLLAFLVSLDGGGTSIVVGTPGGSAATISDRSQILTRPTLVRQGSDVILFQQQAVTSDKHSNRLAIRPLATAATAKTTLMPPIINASGTDVSKPAFSPDGRYLAYVRFASAAPEPPRLFVFDTKTQLLLSSVGVLVIQADPDPIANVLQPGFGGIDLFVSRVFVNTALVNGTLTFSLASTSSVGIIVQRIVGKTRLFGRRVPKLKLVGRVPLGEFEAGPTHTVAWDQRIDGKRLKRGRYLVTLRSVTPDVEVLDLGEPVEIRVRRRPPP